jgi:DNA-binding transcriptional LysR family regulator
VASLILKDDTQRIRAARREKKTAGKGGTILEGRVNLAGIGAKRRCPIWVPYFTAAVRCVPGTPFLATVPSRLAGFESNNPALKILKPPEVLGRFNYLMAWHPRMNTDAAHLWLRRAIRETANVLSQSVAGD